MRVLPPARSFRSISNCRFPVPFPDKTSKSLTWAFPPLASPGQNRFFLHGVPPFFTLLFFPAAGQFRRCLLIHSSCFFPQIIKSPVPSAPVPQYGANSILLGSPFLFVSRLRCPLRIILPGFFNNIREYSLLEAQFFCVCFSRFL